MPTLVQASPVYGAWGSTKAATFSSGVSSGNTVLFIIKYPFGDIARYSGGTCTDNQGGTYTQSYISPSASSETTAGILVFRRDNVTDAPTVITHTLTQDGLDEWFAVEVSGLAAGGPADIDIIGSAASVNLSVSVGTAGTDSFALACIACANAYAFAGLSGSTAYQKDATNYVGFATEAFSGETTFDVAIDTTGRGHDAWVLTYAGEAAAAVPTISSVTPSTITAGSNPVITGTNFEATQGTGTVKLSPTDNVADAAAVTQSITSWGDTSITLNGVSFPDNTADSATLYVFVTNDSGGSNASGEAVTASIVPTTMTLDVVIR